MPDVRILLRDIETGDEAWHIYTIESERASDPDDPEGFWWTDGNAACDCERMRCLALALNRERKEIPCGSQRVVIVQATVDGVVKPWSDD